MKDLNKTAITLGCFFLIATLIAPSCYKKFDPKSYAPPFTISGFSSSSEIASSNLVGYWPFDGSLIDSVSGTVGTNTGTSFSDGFKGQALKGALNGYVLSGGVPSANILNMTSFTLSFWVNTPPPSTGIIGLFSLSKTDGFWGNIEMFFENGSTNAAGKFRTHLFNGTSDQEFASNDLINLFDKWVNITASYDGGSSTYKLYVNGSLASTVTNSGFGPLHITNPGQIVFGTAQFMTNPSQTSATDAQSWASYLTGQLDEVRLYNTVLTPQEINALVVLQGKGK